jgi:hypothetical protein
LSNKNYKEKTSSSVLGVRMPSTLKEKLKNIAEERNQSLNQLANIALEEWLQSLAYSKKIKFIIIHKEFFAELLKLIEDNKKNDLAENMAHLTAEIFRDLLNIPLSKSTFKDFIDILPSFLCDSGLKWFENLEVIIQDNGTAILKGFHYLGIDFSKFFTTLSNYLLDIYFDYSLIEENLNLTPNSIFLRFRSQG